MRRNRRQLGLALPRGRGRPRKPEGQRRGHRPRPLLASRYPVHVTLKAVAGAPHLRRGVCWRAIRGAFVAGKAKAGFRLVHFTVQGNHLHLICEASDRVRLARGMQGLAIRIARRLNRRVERKGKLFAERYHARILRTPTEVRHALVYVLNNSRRHDPTIPQNWIDPLSSAPWFTGWRWQFREPWARREDLPPVVPAGTWLLQKGWRYQGLIAFDEMGRAHWGHQ
jgi:REP element-mobilizing transposase RayT